MDRIAFALSIPLVLGGLRIPAGSTLVFRRHDGGGSTVTACVEVEAAPAHWVEMLAQGVLQPVTASPDEALATMLGIVGPSGAPPAPPSPPDASLPQVARHQRPLHRG